MVGHLQAEEILTCGLSKVVIRREVKTGSLVLKLFQVGVLQRPGLCCRPKHDDDDDAHFKCLYLTDLWGNMTNQLTEEVQVSALLGGTVLVLGYAGVRPQDTVGAGHQVVPHMLVHGGVVVN